MDPQNHFTEANRLECERNSLAQERTQLATERTFLAWIRTGLTSIGIGIALARLVLFQTIEHQQIAHFIGRFLILWGTTLFILALLNYRRHDKENERSKTAFVGLTILTSLLILISFILFWIVVS